MSSVDLDNAGSVTFKNHQDRQKDGTIENTTESGFANTAKKETLRQRLSDPDYRRKCMRTLWLGASFWALGFALSQRGPAFLDLQIITQTNVEEASFFFTGSSVGYLAGSLIAGMVYDKLNKSALLLLCDFGLAITTISIPWCSVYGMMIAIHFLSSVFGGGLDTIANAELLRIWGKDGEMAMQFIHFFYAFGGVIGPLVTEPFLTPNPEDDYEFSPKVSPELNYLANNASSAVNLSVTGRGVINVNMTNNATNNTPPLTTIVHYSYMISGCVFLLVCIPVFIQFFTDRTQKKRQGASEGSVSIKQHLPTGLFLFVLLTLCLLYYLYCATEDTFAAYLTTYVVKELHWSKSHGAQVTSLFWAAFAIGRFSSIFTIYCLSSVKLLFFSAAGLTLSLLSFLLFSQNVVTVGVWVASFLAGVSMAATFPTGFTWMESELLRVTGRVASSILIASSSGTMTNPIILGYLMQELTPMWYCYLLFGESVACFVVFLFLLAFSRFYLKKHYPGVGQEIVVPDPKQNIPLNTVL